MGWGVFFYLSAGPPGSQVRRLVKSRRFVLIGLFDLAQIPSRAQEVVVLPWCRVFFCDYNGHTSVICDGSPVNINV